MGRNGLAWVAMAIVVMLGMPVLAQEPSGPSVKVGEAVFVKLNPPAYPPIARQARIYGRVELSVDVRPDGSVADVRVIAGHPLLAPAAVESAQESQFECKGCETTTTFHVVYQFDLEAPKCGQSIGPPKIGQVGSVVTIAGQPPVICDPPVQVGERSKARSVKCLYLWKCG